MDCKNLRAHPLQENGARGGRGQWNRSPRIPETTALTYPGAWKRPAVVSSHEVRRAVGRGVPGGTIWLIFLNGFEIISSEENDCHIY